MQFRQVTLPAADRHDGVVVVVDVLRAFTVAALALNAGARAVCCVATVEEALAVRAASPNSLAMGEAGGRPPPGFDLGVILPRRFAGPTVGAGAVLIAVAVVDLTALLQGRPVDPAPYLRRVGSSDAARAFLHPDDPDLPAADVEQAVRLDVVAFALRAQVEHGHPVLRAHRAVGAQAGLTGGRVRPRWP